MYNSNKGGNTASYFTGGLFMNLEELRKEFELEIHDDRLKKQYETYLKNLKEQLKENE